MPPPGGPQGVVHEERHRRCVLAPARLGCGIADQKRLRRRLLMTLRVRPVAVCGCDGLWRRAVRAGAVDRDDDDHDGDRHERQRAEPDQAVRTAAIASPHREQERNGGSPRAAVRGWQSEATPGTEGLCGGNPPARRCRARCARPARPQRGRRLKRSPYWAASSRARSTKPGRPPS